MKALQLLDHAMLWIARFFAFSALVCVLFAFEEAFRFSFTYSVRETFLGSCLYSVQTMGLIGFGIFILCALASISLWLLRKNTCRLYLGLITSLLLILFVWTIASKPLTDWDWMDSFTLIGYVSILWVCLRPSKKSPPDRINQTSDKEASRNIHRPFHFLARIAPVNPV